MVTINKITGKPKGKPKIANKEKFAYCEPQELEFLAMWILSVGFDIDLSKDSYHDIVFDYEKGKYFAVAECTLPNAQDNTYHFIEVSLECGWDGLNEFQKMDALNFSTLDNADTIYKITSPSTVKL